MRNEPEPSLPEVESIDTQEFLKKALKKQKVAYVPGCNFFPNCDGGFNAMRLNFSHAKPEKIVEGIHRLGEALKEELVSTHASAKIA